MDSSLRMHAVLTASAVFIVAAAPAADFEISRSTIDGGGAMRSTGGDLELSGTIGQPDAGAMSGGAFTLTGGFFFGEPPGDCNSDGGVNLLDYSEFDACASGPDGRLVRSSCACFDQDADEDVDLKDAGAFQRSFGGS